MVISHLSEIKARLSDPIYIAFGANLGDPVDCFQQAIAQLEQGEVTVLAMSGLWQSPSWPPGVDAPDYTNACAQVEFDDGARELLELLHRIEAAQGRERTVLNAPRTLDLDLLDFRGQHIVASNIQIPHPRMMSRGFVLFPLSQISPNWTHPVTYVGIETAISQLLLNDIAPMEYLGRQKFSTSMQKCGKNT